MTRDDSTCIADYFKEKFPIAQLRYKMYDKDDIYRDIPELVFRFSDSTSEDLYTELKICVESFKGKLNWTIYKGFYNKKYKNYSMVPEEYYLKEKQLYENNEFLNAKECFTESKYKEICEKAVEDIPGLCIFIQNHFN